jgi:hypothetical protein
VITFNKIRNITSPTKRVDHQYVDSTNDFPSPPSTPTSSRQFSSNLLFLAFFRFLNLWGHFDGLNEVFFGSITSMISKGYYLSPKMNLLDNTFPTSYHAPQTNIVCQSYAPEKLIHQTTQNGVHKTVGFSSFRVRVLDFIYDKNAFGASF